MHAFYAYPGEPNVLGDDAKNAKERLKISRADLDIRLWEENDICGRPLTDPIFKEIDKSDFLISDITCMNFNVTFEIGYAVGLGKRVYLVRNGNYSSERTLIDRIGIFDTLGYEKYSDPSELASYLGKISDIKGIPLRNIVNTKSPTYVLQTPQSSAAMISITARIKKARLSYKSYLPSDETRLSAPKAIDDISACLGAVVPLLPHEYVDSQVHNIRSAFVAGLAVAMGKVVLILQPKDGPAPLDVRDLVFTFSDDEDIAKYIAEFALNITERLQNDDPLPVSKTNFLSDLSIGDSVAENEMQTLGKYYLITDEYKRASRGEVNMVVGRKGAGKTALFSQLRNEKRRNTSNIVVDLKPEGYQLIRLKENVADFLSEGAKRHLITAFFEYVFYLEICYKVLEKDSDRHTRDGRLYQPYRVLQEAYESGTAGSGDFSERLLGLSRDLASEFRRIYGNVGEQRLTAEDVTELVHKNKIPELRKALSYYLKFKDSVWVLFDNLDKGWTSHGLVSADVLILRCLIDASRKIQRQMQQDDHDFHSIVFVRNDVYQLLIESSADFGKESRAALDWTDFDLLRELLRRRLLSPDISSDTRFERVWARVCVSHYDGEETSQYLIDRCLMRPRNLIKLFGHCRGFAVSLERERIEKEDIEKGLKAYSLDLITEADQELTDVLGESTSLIYYFIGEGNEFNALEIRSILSLSGVADAKIEQVLEFLIYYGFIGIKTDFDKITYIYNLGYDMKLMNVLIGKYYPNIKYVLNPAFYPALNL